MKKTLLFCFFVYFALFSSSIFSQEETTLKLIIEASTDDAEQSVGNSEMKLTSSDLEMVYDGTEEIDHYIVGMRFNNATIPSGATITYAAVKFLIKEEQISGEISLTINGEKSANAETFSEAAGNISARLLTTASVEWSPQSWTDLADQNDSTPDLKTIIQEVIGLPEWESGNSIAIIVSGPVGTGASRTAYAFDDEPELAPILNIKYTVAVPSGILDKETLNSNHIAVYPNPAMDKVTLEFGNHESPFTAKIYCMDGSVVFSKVIDSGKDNTVNLDVSNWAKGAYVVVVEDGKTVKSRILSVQ
jgi:hypothetical protein